MHAPIHIDRLPYLQAILAKYLAAWFSAGGISFTRADYTEEGSGGNFKTADDYTKAMSGLTMYPEVRDACISLTLACKATYI